MRDRLQAIGQRLFGGELPLVGRFPIAVLSFNRPHYLQQVLVSLRPQVSEEDTIILFQDGARNAYSGRMRGDPRLISFCVGVFKAIFPWGIVAESRHNIGVAENYERAEQAIFVRRKARYALFLEDDLVLSPNYLAVTRMLLELARRNPRISYVSACGNLWADQDEQRARAGDLIPMHQFWGFAMTRHAWLAERAFRRRYLRFVEGRDYAERPHEKIRQFYRDIGWKVEETSQDLARAVASLERGCVRLTTFPCHARYIGRVGLHCSEEHYARQRYGSSVLFSGSPPEPRAPGEDEIEAWLAEERRARAVDRAA